MFDIGFSELLVIGIVALVVIGPERMPAVARTVGHLCGRAKRYVNEVKADINREVGFSDFERMQGAVTDTARQWEDAVRREYEAARGAVAAPVKELESALTEVKQMADKKIPAQGG